MNLTSRNPTTPTSTTHHSYVFATAFLLKYGLRMLRFSQLALPPVLRRRLLLLCSVCAAAFLLHALYYTAVATQVALAGPTTTSTTESAALLHGGYPPARWLPGGSAFAFDALFYPFMELLPSAAILFALHHRRRSYLLAEGGGGGVGSYSVRGCALVVCVEGLGLVRGVS